MLLCHVDAAAGVHAAVLCREQLQQQASDAATSAAESTLAAALQAQLEEQGRELVRLQGELMVVCVCLIDCLLQNV